MRELGRNHTRLHDAPQRQTRRTARAFTAATLVVLSASLLATVPAQAAPGDLDSSFSGDGRQITDFGGGESGAGVAVPADGRVVVAGGGDGDFALSRYNPDGSLDTSFGAGGRQTTDFGGSDQGSAVAIQPGGKIVVAGLAGGDFALSRYNPDGSLDPSFGVGGKQTTDFGGFDYGHAVAIQIDGKIVVAGDSRGDFALSRYNPDGSLDTSFGAGGRQTTDFGGSEQGSAVAIQPGGKIVVAGLAGGDFALSRYNADGSLDSSFGVGGKQTTDFPGGYDAASGVAIQPDGRIVAAGFSIPSDGGDFGDFALARYDTNGSLDTSFGAGGKQTTDFDVEDRGYAVAIQTDGKIVVAGKSGPDFTLGRGDFALARYNTNGSLDTTFSGDGKQTTDFNFGGEDPEDAGRGVAIQPDGKIVVAGVTSPGGGPGDFALARYQGGSGASGTAPTSSSPPTISGTAAEGQVLTVNSGAWTGSTPINRSYQWRRCDSAAANCVDIAAATAITYALAAADVGHAIRVRETATNTYGQSSVDSAASAVVKAMPGTIAGTVRNLKNGATIANASVNCGSGYSATTASDGRYSIAIVAPGTYSCTASANRYQPSTTTTVTVGSGQRQTVDFSLVRQ